MFDDKKSKRSKKPTEELYSAEEACPVCGAEANIPTAPISTRLMRAAFLRGILNSSDIHSVGTSTRESIAPFAAKAVRKKCEKKHLSKASERIQEEW